jgi:phosphate transport system permease protein
VVERQFNWIFFTRGASREAEMAGILGAVVGSVLTLVVTLALSFPLGVAAAVYLEEFAPKNRWTDLIEVNINNLAAVPSIVFGLLGLAVFLNFFGMPRSAPLVGGMVLALITLPTIIIASRACAQGRAALYPRGRAGRRRFKAADSVPSRAAARLARRHDRHDYRDGACAGRDGAALDDRYGRVHRRRAKRVPRFGDHPARADLHVGRLPEVAFQQKTSAAIIVSAAFLIVMNAVAVLLRRRFERRW